MNRPTPARWKLCPASGRGNASAWATRFGEQRERKVPPFRDLQSCIAEPQGCLDSREFHPAAHGGGAHQRSPHKPWVLHIPPGQDSQGVDSSRATFPGPPSLLGSTQDTKGGIALWPLQRPLLTVGIGELSRPRSWIKRARPWWLNWILLWGAHVRRATVTILWRKQRNEPRASAAHQDAGGCLLHQENSPPPVRCWPAAQGAGS